MKIKSNTSLSLRKFLLSALVAAPLATLPAPLWALPQTTGGNVTSSSATTTFQSTGSVLSITDPTATRLVLRWVNFGSGTSDIPAGSTVLWNLPSSSSAVLNTVSTGATLVDGGLQSNGSIFILNPNGIVLGNTATVLAAGLGLSTISEPEFFFVNNGNLSYSGTTVPSADIVVGTSTINVGTTGSVFIAGRNSDVSGTITAGTLNISSASSFTTGVRLGQAGALTLGVAGVAATLTDPSIPGTGNLIVNTNGGPAVLSGAATTSILGGSATITTGGGAVTQGAGRFAVGDGVNSSNLTLNTGLGAVTLGNLGYNSTSNLIRNNVSLTTGVTSITSVGRIALGAGVVTGNGVGDALTVRSTGGNGMSIDSGGDVTVTGGSISLTTAGSNSGITFKGPGDLVFSTVATFASTGSGVTLTSTTGSVSLPLATISGNLAVTAGTNIVQTGAITNSNANTRTSTFDAATGSITLADPSNNFNRVVLKNAPGGVTLVEKDSVIIASGTNVTGAASITAGGNIALGAGSGDAVRFNSTLALTALATTGNIVVTPVVTGAGAGYTSAPTVALTAPPAGGTQATATATVDTTTGILTGINITNAGSGYAAAPAVTLTGGGFTTAATATVALAAPGITDGSDNTVVVGALTMTAPGAIILDGSASNGIGLNTSFGQINATAGGPVRIYEATTLNFGTITAPSLRAYSTTGIIQSGILTIAGASEFGAGTAAAPGDVTLTGTNVLTGPISILNDFALLGNTAVNIAAIGVGSEPTVGTYLARNVTISNTAGTTYINRIAGTAGNGLVGDLTINGNNIIFGTPLGVAAGEAAQVNVGGRLFVGGGGLTAQDLSSDIKNVTVVLNGNVDFRTGSNVTVNATLTQAAAGATASFRSNQGITLGTINSDYTGTVRFATGSSRAITDSVAGLRVYGPVQFVSNSGITINKAGHSFGGVTIATANNGSATIVESGGLRLVDVNIGGSGSLTATSTTGDILQDANFANGAAGIRIGNNTTSARATFTATAGSVLLTDAGRNVITVPINATAANDVVISQARNNLSLGNITAGGKLTVDKSTAGATTAIAAPAAGAGGTGYTVAPTVAISAPNTAGGVQATATATINTVATSTSFGFVTGFVVTNPGSGYTTAPTVTLTGGTFTTAATPGAATIVGLNSDITQWAGTRLNVYDTVTLRVQGAGQVIVDNTGNRMGGIVASAGTGTLFAIPVLTGGAGYTSAPAVALSAPNIPGGTQATAVANLTGGVVTSYTVTNPGSGYTAAPAVTLTGGGFTTAATTGVVVSSLTGNITLRENTTMNLKSIATGGNLTATSEAGSIIDSVDATVANNSIFVGNTATLSAATGSITLGLAGSNFANVGFTSKGASSVIDSFGNITLAASVIGGSLDVFSTAAGGTINQSGALNVKGGTTFTTNAGIIDLGSSANEFGGIRFTANTVSITENTTMNLRAGSVANGPAILNTNGNFITSGLGGSSFIGSLTINAPNGSIIPGAGSLLVVGTFTVFSNVLKDLGGLSKSGNLTNKDPINLGTGTYVPPGP